MCANIAAEFAAVKKYIAEERFDKAIYYWSVLCWAIDYLPKTYEQRCELERSVEIGIFTTVLRPQVFRLFSDYLSEKKAFSITQLPKTAVVRCGEVVGTLKIISEQHLVEELSRVKPDEVVVVPFVPADYRKVTKGQGMIVGGVSPELNRLDHSSVLSARWNIPHVALPFSHIWLKGFDGQRVLFTASKEEEIRLRIVSAEEETDWRAQQSRKMIAIPKAYTADSEFLDLIVIGMCFSHMVGMKAAALGQLVQDCRTTMLPEIPKGIAVSFRVYHEVLQRNPHIGELIDDVLDAGKTDVEDERVVAGKLERIRDAITEAAFAQSLKEFSFRDYACGL